MITKELLEGQIKQLTAQKENAIAVFNQASGALQLCEFLLSQVGEEPALSEDQLAEMIGGKGSYIDHMGPNSE
jgi:hypothetical protein